MKRNKLLPQINGIKNCQFNGLFKVCIPLQLSAFFEKKSTAIL